MDRIVYGRGVLGEGKALISGPKSEIGQLGHEVVSQEASATTALVQSSGMLLRRDPCVRKDVINSGTLEEKQTSARG
jgi:hypothetical protein